MGCLKAQEEAILAMCKSATAAGSSSLRAAGKDLFFSARTRWPPQTTTALCQSLKSKLPVLSSKTVGEVEEHADFPAAVLRKCSSPSKHAPSAHKTTPAKSSSSKIPISSRKTSTAMTTTTTTTQTQPSLSTTSHDITTPIKSKASSHFFTPNRMQLRATPTPMSTTPARKTIPKHPSPSTHTQQQRQRGMLPVSRRFPSPSLSAPATVRRSKAQSRIPKPSSRSATKVSSATSRLHQLAMWKASQQGADSRPLRKKSPGSFRSVRLSPSLRSMLPSAPENTVKGLATSFAKESKLQPRESSPVFNGNPEVDKEPAEILGMPSLDISLTSILDQSLQEAMASREQSRNEKQEQMILHRPRKMGTPSGVSKIPRLSAQTPLRATENAELSNPNKGQYRSPAATSLKLSSKSFVSFSPWESTPMRSRVQHQNSALTPREAQILLNLRAESEQERAARAYLEQSASPTPSMKQHLDDLSIDELSSSQVEETPTRLRNDTANKSFGQLVRDLDLDLTLDQSQDEMSINTSVLQLEKEQELQSEPELALSVTGLDESIQVAPTGASLDELSQSVLRSPDVSMQVEGGESADSLFSSHPDTSVYDETVVTPMEEMSIRFKVAELLSRSQQERHQREQGTPQPKRSQPLIQPRTPKPSVMFAGHEMPDSPAPPQVERMSEAEEEEGQTAEASIQGSEAHCRVEERLESTIKGQETIIMEKSVTEVQEQPHPEGAETVTVATPPNEAAGEAEVEAFDFCSPLKPVNASGAVPSPLTAAARAPAASVAKTPQSVQHAVMHEQSTTAASQPPTTATLHQLKKENETVIVTKTETETEAATDAAPGSTGSWGMRVGLAVAATAYLTHVIPVSFRNLDAQIIPMHTYTAPAEYADETMPGECMWPALDISQPDELALMATELVRADAARVLANLQAQGVEKARHTAEAERRQAAEERLVQQEQVLAQEVERREIEEKERRLIEEQLQVEHEARLMAEQRAYEEAAAREEVELRFKAEAELARQALEDALQAQRATELAAAESSDFMSQTSLRGGEAVARLLEAQFLAEQRAVELAQAREEAARQLEDGKMRAERKLDQLRVEHEAERAEFARRLDEERSLRQKVSEDLQAHQEEGLRVQRELLAQQAKEADLRQDLRLQQQQAEDLIAQQRLWEVERATSEEVRIQQLRSQYQRELEARSCHVEPPADKIEIAESEKQPENDFNSLPDLESEAEASAGEVTSVGVVERVTSAAHKTYQTVRRGIVVTGTGISVYLGLAVLVAITGAYKKVPVEEEEWEEYSEDEDEVYVPEGPAATPAQRLIKAIRSPFSFFTPAAGHNTASSSLGNGLDVDGDLYSPVRGDLVKMSPIEQTAQHVFRTPAPATRLARSNFYADGLFTG